MFTADIDTLYKFRITLFNNIVSFQIFNSNGSYLARDIIKISETPLKGFGYGLRPYFGGDNVAPHTMFFKIKDNI